MDTLKVPGKGDAASAPSSPLPSSSSGGSWSESSTDLSWSSLEDTTLVSATLTMPQYPPALSAYRSPPSSIDYGSPSPSGTTELPGAAFYGPLDAKNPLLASFQREMQGVLGFLRRKQGRAASLQERQTVHLFNIWNKYKARLPPKYYNDQLLKVGDSLIQIQQYKLALSQCYGRYLSQFNCTVEEREMDVYQFKSMFFPNGPEDRSSSLTFRALEGKCICIYQVICASDPSLQSEISVSQCFNILSSLRLIMQVALPQERLCWIIYNGTIHIYTLCRKLMVIGLSAKALEYLLWASICMESCIPLLAVRYLNWRATLYTAVSQCYYDCQAGIQGEIFARRGLGKIDELLHLEVMSLTPPQEEAKRSFREATIKMAVMIFKRAAFEPRRKSKPFIRAKPRISLREAQNLQWPRTPTEKLLVEMFDSSSSQFLAVLEALSEPRRRVLQTGPPTSEEPEIREVFAELFMAGSELFSASGKYDFFKTVSSVSSQMKLAVEGNDSVSIAAAVKLIKLFFTFEEWNLFHCTAAQFINFLQSRKDPASRKAEMDLRLLAAMEPLINVKRNKGLAYTGEGANSITDGGRSIGKKIVFQGELGKTFLTCYYSDDIFHLGSMLFSFICSADEKVQPDSEIVVDLIMFLWQKCKMGIQQVYSAKMEYFKFVQKVKNNKWIHLLWQINEMIYSYQTEDINPVVVAEVSLRLSEILETLGNPEKKFKKCSARRGPETPEEQLLLAYEILDKAITTIGMSRTRSTLPNGTSVYDHCHAKVRLTSGKTLTANSLIMDLQMEIILAQHRIAVMLLDQLKGIMFCFAESYVLKKINKNRISKAIYLMQKALILFEKDPLQDHKLLEEALSLIKKTESEQSALYSYQKDAEDGKLLCGKVPFPPILISRTHCSVTFKPAPFVDWYTILGCQMGTGIGKVRLNSHCLSNSGQPVPANDKTLLEVVGLEPNEKYIFAVAAYGSDGELIGEAIGETSKPVLVYTPLSTVTTRLYLTEVAYQIGKYSLAKKAFAPVWDYFVYTPSPANTSIISLNSMLTITPHRLYTDTLSESSSVLLYHFLRCVFVMSSINIVEQKLFCDAIRGNEVFTCQQAVRLAECQRMLVAIELSTHLNDLSYSLQAVVQCYGLLAPLIFHNIVLVPAIQILIKCLVVLQEIPNVNFPRRQMGNFESIQHMIACSVYYTAKVLRSWKEFDLAVIIINFGKKLLDTSQGLFSNVGKASFGDDEQEDVTEEGIPTKKVKKSKGQIVMLDKISEQLNLMETQLLKLTKQNPYVELTGAEDPLFLYPIILTWTLRGATKEVMKFKNKPRFLEFFVQVMTKCIHEEKFNYVVDMSYTVQNFLKRRNDNYLGIKKVSGTDSTSANEDPKKYKATAMEIQKVNLTFKRTDVRKIAFKILIEFLCPKVVNYVKRKRLHQLFIEELPWRAQMNVHLAYAHFSLFKIKLAERKKMKVCSSQNAMRYGTFSFGAESPKVIVSAEVDIDVKDRTGNLGVLDHFVRTFLHCRRAVVLAHRGGYWTLLQNASRILWNYALEVQMLFKQAHVFSRTFPLSKDAILCTFVLPFYLTSEALLDMLLDLQNSKSLKILDDNKDFGVPSAYGGIEDDDGGLNLTFEDPFDDMNLVDLKYISDFIFKTLEILYRVGKWETLAHIALHFNEITHEKYTEQVTPLLVYAQRKLLERVEKFSGQEIIEIENEIEAKVREISQANRLVSVPLNVKETLRYFRETLGKSKYHNRSLRHSRKLLTLFLANTQDTLEINNQTDLKIQALHELGNLHIYAENRREAYKCWSQALDAILKKTDVLHTWKELANPPKKPLDIVMGSYFTDYSEEFLSKAGIWGCLQGGVIASKMAQYILTSNVSERTECCIFSSYFFKALFRMSLIHPRHDHEYAQYEIGQLTPGLDLFCDRHRADVTVVLGSLIYLIYELHSVKHNLIILPLLSLHQYFVSEVCQDLCKCIDAKILKVMTHWLFNTLSRFYVALEDLLNRSIPGCVTLMCQPTFIYKFTLVKMRFFIQLAATINCLPESEVKSFFQEFPQRSKFQVTCNKGNPRWGAGILLTEAEDKLLMLIENAESSICKRIIQFSPVELEIMIEVKLQLAAIAMQRQQAPYSASIAFTAIKILQNAEVFQKTKEEIYENPDELDALEPLGMLAREHLNIHMWLRCRLALVVASVAHIRGMGFLKENEVTDCRHLINEVVVEARDWNDTEMQAEVLVQAVKLDLQERHPAAEIIKHLRDIINLLEGKPFISPRGSLILVKSLVLMDDLLKIEEPQKYLSPGNENFNLLNQAHALIIEQALSLGETIRLASSDSDYANIMYPLRNIYLPYINLMAKVKMRIAHMLAKQVASSGKRDSSQWAPVIHLFEKALYHCRTAAIREGELEAEILFEKGKLERQMFIADETTHIANDLFEAIKTSLKNDQNLSKAAKAAQKLLGRKNILMEKIKMVVLQNIPEFAVVDLTSTYIDYLTASYKAVFKSPFSSPSQSDNIPDNSKRNEPDISWVHLVCYYTQLLRVNNMNTLLASPKPVFLADEVFHTSVFNEDLILRHKELHGFLKKFLRVFTPACIEPFPKDLPLGEISVLVEKFAASKNSLTPPDLTDFAVYTISKDLCFQWYLPPLEKSPKETEPMVNIIYDLLNIFLKLCFDSTHSLFAILLI
uniref:Fibronectin type-III domain-containing protein n=1 Tax=Vombatus ursinus TaxID=29139 RepID=A0A4X2M5R0_VOMUR